MNRSIWLLLAVVLVIGFLVSILLFLDGLTFHGSRESNLVAITFDDGPSEVTQEILAILKQSNTTATFFVVGERITNHEALLQEMQTSGHEIGVHSWSHTLLYLKGYTTIRDDLTKSVTAIHQVISTKPVFYRPPYGIPSPNQLKAARELQLQVVMWDVMSNDYKLGSPDEITTRVLAKAKSGSIIVFHDYGLTGERTLQALPHIITTLRDRGYRFVTVSELLNEGD